MNYANTLLEEKYYRMLSFKQLQLETCERKTERIQAMGYSLRSIFSKYRAGHLSAAFHAIENEANAV